MSEKKALRFNKGKLDLTYLLEFPKAMRLFCLICAYGEHKYGRNNFKLGNKPDLEYWKSTMRHLQDFYATWNPYGDQPEKHDDLFDEESGLLGIGHAIWNLIAFVELNVPDDYLMKFDSWEEFFTHCEEVHGKFRDQRETV
jgi:hypothetical protein